MRAYENIGYESEGHVAIITIRREASRNALDDLTNNELGQAFDHFEQDDDAWVAIITGAGDTSFCAGNDMKKRAAGATRSKDKWSGGAHRLPRSLSWQREIELLLTGRPIDAKKALDWGVVNEVAPGDELMTRAKAWAQEIAVHSPLAVPATKETAAKGLSWPLEDVIDHSFPGRERLRASEDFKEASCAFAEKRKPIWTGT